MAIASRVEKYSSVYVHVPFCGRRCAYCDFSIAVRAEVPVQEYIDAILAEIAARGIRMRADGKRTLYLGGGTPSRLGPDGVRALFGALGRALEVGDLGAADAREIEVTLEANPEDVTGESVAAWRHVGVNRVSLGVQSFDSRVLAWMHRSHGPERAEEAVRFLRAGGIADVSLDLIFAVPEMLTRDWSADLARALALEPTHLSLYGLTVEPQTPLGRWTARGEVREAPEDRYAAEFLEAHAALVAAGFAHYEVSSFARPGFRARHNSMYWARTPYAGLGPSAHGYDGQVRRWNRRGYLDWRSAVAGDPIEGSEEVGPAEQLAEEVYLGLRTSDGLHIHQNDLSTVTPWVGAGWAVVREDAQQPPRLRLTPEGWLRLDALAAALTMARSRS